MYIYIYCHPLTVSLYHNPSVRLDTRDAIYIFIIFVKTKRVIISKK